MRLLLILVVLLTYSSLSLSHEKRIVNGKRVAPGTANFVASIQSDKYKGHFCSGAYIGNGWVITAGHCFRELKMCGVEVVMGNLNLGIKPNRTYKVLRGVKKEFEEYTFQNDIALLKIDENLDGIFEALNIPESLDLEIENCKIFGYGSVDYAGERSQFLLEGNVEIISHSTCLKSMGAVMTPDYPQMFCARGIRGVDACGGDSGGSCICSSQNTTYLIGLVSYGMGCGKTAGAYTNVIHHLPWIKKHISEL